MVKIFEEYEVPLPRMKRLANWVRKNSTFGAFIEVEETVCKSGLRFHVKIFQEKTRVDKYGNRYVIQD